MSLINEALKRADEEKRQHLAGETPPGPANADRAAPRPRWGRRLAILGAILLIVMALAAYGVWWTAGRMLRQAAAAVDELADQNAALATGSAAAAPTAPAVPAAPASAADPDAPAPALVPFPERLHQFGRGATGGLSASVLEALAASGQWHPAYGSHSIFPETALASSAPADVPAGSDAKPPDAAAPTEAQPKPPPPSPAEVPAPEPKPPPEPVPEAKAPEKAPTPAPPDTSGLKISSILVGPRGGTAIINGQSVHVGETIAGAKVLEITRREVLVEIAGQRVALRM